MRRKELSDIVKIGGLTILSLILNNPIPLMFAQRHANNLRERMKAKEKELKTLRKQALRGRTKVAKRQVAKNTQEQKSLSALEKRNSLKALPH